MLSLDSDRWAQLQHAYGSAADIPALLVGLRRLPKSEGEAEPWFTIWSALAHQGDVYAASFAAVPHVIEALAIDPPNADSAYFQFPAWVEICRVRKSAVVPSDLRDAYFGSLNRLPTLAAAAAAVPWDDSRLACVLSAIAAARGHVDIAEVVLETSSENAERLLEWLREQ
jgi:hypothetical protein